MDSSLATCSGLLNLLASLAYSTSFKYCLLMSSSKSDIGSSVVGRLSHLFVFNFAVDAWVGKVVSSGEEDVDDWVDNVDGDVDEGQGDADDLHEQVLRSLVASSLIDGIFGDLPGAVSIAFLEWNSL